MKMNFDMDGRLAEPFGLASGNHAASPLDWHALHARLTAGYAARSELERSSPQETAIAGGSFDRGSARALAVFGDTPAHGLHAVNPTGLATGNSGCDKDAVVAGTYSAGERG